MEKEYLQWNFESDQGQQDNADEVGAWKGAMMALVDPKTWFMMGTLYSVSQEILPPLNFVLMIL